MCLFIDSDTILANILANKLGDEGIGIYEIKKYCLTLNKFFSKKSYPYRYFDVSNESLERAVIANNEVFMYFGGKFFRKTPIDVDNYNRKYDERVCSFIAAANSCILKEVVR